MSLNYGEIISQNWEQKSTFIRTLGGILTSFIPVSIFFLADKDSKWSQILSNYMDDISVNAYIVKSESLFTTFTFPGQPKTSDPNVRIFSAIPGVRELIELCSFVEYIISIVSMRKDYPEPMLVNNKISLDGISEISIYHSIKFFSILNEQENIAIDLHEIGHNANLFLILKASLVGNGLLAIASMILSSLKHDIYAKNITTIDEAMSVVSVYKLSIIALIGVLLLSFFIKRKIEWRADSFAIKCGYGNELASGLEKMHNFYKHGRFFSEKGFLSIFHLFQGILYGITQMLAHLGFSTHPATSDRILVAKMTPSDLKVAPDLNYIESRILKIAGSLSSIYK